MQKNFTKLISGFTQAKKYVIAATSLMFILAGSVYLMAAVALSPVQDFSISADKAKNGISPAFTTLADIVITEGNSREFSTSTGTFTLTPPTGWQFNASGTVTAIPNSSNVTNVSVSRSATSIVVSFGINNTSTNTIDQITIRGVEVQALNGTILYNNSEVILNSSIEGIGLPAPVARLNQTYGAARKLAFGTQPANANIHAAITPAPTVLIQDFFGNTVANATNNVTLAIGTNPSGGTLAAGTATRSNGVVTFSGYSVNAAGTGYTLVASSAGLTAATSNAFNITSRTPAITSLSPCITEEAGNFTLTVTGSNFDRNAVGRVNGVDRVTTYINANEVRIAVLASDVATAGAKAVTVVNPANLSATQNLSVNPSFTNASIGGKTTVCTEEQVVYSAPTGFSGYSWLVSEGASVVATSGNTATIKYTNTAPASGKVTIQVAANSACGVRGNTSFEVTVNQTPAAVLSAASATTFCQGGSVILSAPEAPAGQSAFSYQWYNGATQVGTNSSTYTALATGNYTVVVSAPNGCSKTSNAVAVSVTPTISQGTVAGTTGYCQNASASTLSSTVTGGGSAALTYLWEQSTTGTSNWVNAAGANNQASYTPSTTSAGTLYYRRTVSGGGCVSVGEHVAVTVTPTIQNAISGTQSVCSGSAVAALTGTLSGGADDVAYLWEQSTTGTGNWAAASNSPNNQASYTPETRTVTANSSTYYRRRVISGNCTSYSNSVTVTVTAPPVATILQGANTYFCPPIPAALTAEDGVGYRYTWYKVVEGGSDQVIGSTRETSTAEEGIYYVKVIDANNCESTSARITVRQTVVDNNIISGTQTICYGETPTTINGSTATPGVEGEKVLYQWQSSTDGNAFTNITTGGTSEDLVLGVHTADRWYRRVARVGSCSLTSSVVEVTVKQELKLNTTLSPSAICSGSTFSYTPGSDVSGATFAWSRAAVTGISNAASGTGAVNETLVNTSAAPVQVTYVYVTSGNGCQGIPQSVVVTVNPTPVLSSTLAPAALCSGATFSYTPTTATANASLSWTRQAATGITSNGPASGTGNISQTLTNAGTAPVNVTYSYTLTANGCSNTQDVVVTVNPMPVLSSTLAPAAICSGATFSYTPTTATANASLSWTRQAATGITSNGPASGTGNISQTLTNAGTAPVNVTYSYTLTANGCSNTQDVVVTVNPMPKLSSTLTPTAVCSGYVFSYSPTTATANTSISWSRALVTGISNTATSGTGVVSETLVNTTNSAVNVTYVYTLSANGCTNVQNVVVSVSPNLAVSFTGTIASSSEFYTAQDAVALTATPTGGTFSGPGVSGSVANGFTFSPCTAGAGTHNITYTRKTGSCTSTVTKTVTVKTSTFTAVNFASPFPICKGQNTEFKAMLYRDVTVVSVTDPRHPDHGQWLNETYEVRKSDPKRYWQDFVGVEPLDANGKLQPAPASLIVNQEDLDAGNDFKNYKFKYQWYRNTNGIGSGRVTAKSAGLSATDEFFVLITPELASNLPCNTSTAAIRSNSMWLSAPTNYSMTLSAPNPICKGDGVRLTATPNVGFDFSSINLEVNFYIKKAGASAESEPTRLNNEPIRTPDAKTNPNNPTTYSFDVPAGVIEDGDVVSIFFSTDVVKCLTSGDAGSFLTMIVNERPAVAAQPSPQTVCANTTATLTVGATGTNLTYQWYKRADNSPTSIGTAVANSDRVSGATGSSLSIANADAGDAGYYYVIVGGACPPTVQSINAQLIINPVTVITQQPTGDTICPGASHTFTTTAVGTALSYQWYRGTTLLAGATGSSHTVSNAAADDAGDYTVQVTGTCGVVTSTVAKLVVNQVTAVTAGPQPVTVCAGQSASFNVTATGTALTYAWRKNGALIPGANSSTYQISSASPTDGGNYSVTVSGACGSDITTEVALLTVNTAPAITASPLPVTVCEGAPANFSVTAGGTVAGYQWLKDGVAIPGATSATYSIGSTSTGDAAAYSVRINGACGELTSTAANLVVNTSPQITTQPVERAVCDGQENVVFNVSATGTGITYQWYRNGGIITGATSSTYTVPVANSGSAGNYTVLVAGTCTPPITSNVAMLTVNSIPLARTMNKPEYCSLANPQGAEILLDNPESEVIYELFSSSGQSLGRYSGTGSTLSLGTRPKGEYTIVGINNNNASCTNTSVGTVTVTDTRKDDIAGDISHKWVGPEKWELTAMADAVVGVVIPSNAVYNWKVKFPGAEDFVDYASSNTQTIIVENLPVGTEVIARVSLTDGMCQLVQFVPSLIIPLPVELIYFKAEKRGNDVALDWATASEQDNKGFEVQVSTDAKNFRSLGFVESKVGTTSLKQLYTFLDKENGKYGTRYYRLKQIDLDGKFEYSSTQAVQFGAVVTNKVKAYPNPFHSEVELSIDAEVKGDVLVTVTNATGQQLLQRTIKVEKGANIEKLILDPNLPRGIYIISTRMGDFTNHFKLLKQ